MPKRKIVIVDGHENKTEARIFWDGKKVTSDSEEFLSYLKTVIGPSIKDGDKFLDSVLRRFKSGYLHAYEIGQSD
jgi:hypothetical protein